MSAIAPFTSLVFIDAAVDAYQSLIDCLGAGSEAIGLDPAQDEVEQITGTLVNRSDIQSVHIVSHGILGSLQLGTATLNGGYRSQTLPSKTCAGCYLSQAIALKLQSRK